jgi:hypothetical protein
VVQVGNLSRPGTRGEVHAMPWQENGPLRFPAIDSTLNRVSPPLTCGQIGTIWSQKGNSYTQIVDLADIDNSRSVLPPGISEDPKSPFHWDQVPLWVKGTTHAAPLSRKRVEALAVSSRTLAVIAYEGPASSGERLAADAGEGGRFVPAIPKADAATSRSKPLAGRKPNDARLETSLRFLIGPDRSREEIDARIDELRAYVKGNADLTAQLASGLRLVVQLGYGTEYARQRMRALAVELSASPR